MATKREQIEHLEHFSTTDKPWKNYSHSRKWLKRQMSKYMRRQTTNEESDYFSKRPYKGWEY